MSPDGLKGRDQKTFIGQTDVPAHVGVEHIADYHMPSNTKARVDTNQHAREPSLGIGSLGSYVDLNLWKYKFYQNNLRVGVIGARCDHGICQHSQILGLGKG